MKKTHLILPLAILFLTGCFTKWFMAPESELTITWILDVHDADKVQLYEDLRTWSEEKFSDSD
ncbi:hypothetical protein GF338_00775, partial [candidate division WOR-3 bacterium]|nr:hypothetical protein [candidate division WOR-3 bacterium]